ncbi:ORF1-encoded protein [Triplophysa rosa]|uniref:ORF1-encoded protein n=1 Tax=Triplophysa rosa TaxID=992332 RepID=A0A9W7TSM5_TRIRA|nr:ORF1-encoded protein [Triplophysa rosa]
MDLQRVKDRKRGRTSEDKRRHFVSDVFVPLSAEEETFALQSELEAVEKQIQDLLEKQSWLRERKTALETSRKSVSPGFENTISPNELHSKARARTGAMTQLPPPVFEIPTRNRFAALCETECNAVVIGDSIVRNVCASSTKGKVRTHCFPGTRVLDVSVQVPAILKDDANVGAVVLHAGVNDVRMRQRIAHGEDHHIRAASYLPTRE